MPGSTWDMRTFGFKYAGGDPGTSGYFILGLGPSCRSVALAPEEMKKAVAAAIVEALTDLLDAPDDKEEKDRPCHQVRSIRPYCEILFICRVRPDISVFGLPDDLRLDLVRHRSGLVLASSCPDFEVLRI